MREKKYKFEVETGDSKTWVSQSCQLVINHPFFCPRKNRQLMEIIIYISCQAKINKIIPKKIRPNDKLTCEVFLKEYQVAFWYLHPLLASLLPVFTFCFCLSNKARERKEKKRKGRNIQKGYKGRLKTLRMPEAWRKAREAEAAEPTNKEATPNALTGIRRESPA